MGVVYQARDSAIGRWVALKRVQLDSAPTAHAREQVRERVRRESRAAGILNHPNIVTIYDAWDEGSDSFIAMEFVEGPNLHQRLRQGPALNAEQVLELADQIADGLDYAHSRGIVHRDLKPGNILFTADGRPKVADFGVAKIVNATITEKGAILGTLHYLSPEQVLGRKLDGRSDIFSFAVILYELLTGQLPFRGANLNETMIAIVQAKPAAPSTLHPALPRQVDEVFDRALAKEPADRFASGRELVLALQAAFQEAPHEVTSAAVPVPHGPELGTPRWEEIPVGSSLDFNTGRLERSSVGDLEIELANAEDEVQPPGRRRRWIGPIAWATGLVAVLGGLYWLLAHGTGERIGPTEASRAPLTQKSSRPGSAAPAAGLRSLRIESVPPGATVLINGDPIEATTPTSLTLDPAVHPKIALRLRGYQEAERTLGPEDAGELISMSLEKLPPAVVRTKGSYAVRIYSGRRRLAELGPGESLRLDPGDYTLTLVQPLYGLRQDHRLELHAGESKVLRLPQLGRRSFKAFPEYCDISLDGTPIGRPPLFDHPVAPGRHQVRFVWQNGATYEETFEVQSDSQGEIVARLPR